MPENAEANSMADAPALDEKTARVLEVLKNPQWAFRTPRGIAEETKLEIDVVETALAELIDRKLARRSVIPDRRGRRLYTAYDRELSIEEKRGLTRAFITKST